MEIAGRVAIVTGGGSGLGAATAEYLAARGARVAVFDIAAAAAQATATRIGGIAITGDVSDGPGMEAAVAEVGERLGPPRILAHCAGIGTAARVVGRDGPMPLEAFERVVRVNLVGTFNMIRLVGAAMAAAEPLDGGERGVIVTTASVAAFEGQIGQAAYAASKAGIAAMTLPVAREFARFGVRVVGIAPGLFATPLLGELPEEARRSIAASIPFPSRLGAPEEFAALVAHAIENRFLNGEVIRLDGAMRLSAK
ncbi:SDR family NAD(P)-dependent oxidoreductase [Prosthecomicrobium sp. N25]|uniref:SDR family NAD(P)-dependent oxidoreductase n=1 Tax=Prosthecomicrobium sp. N25 TaxID=3129254 RepID=UPI0030770B73